MAVYYDPPKSLICVSEQNSDLIHQNKDLLVNKFFMYLIRFG